MKNSTTVRYTNEIARMMIDGRFIGSSFVPLLKGDGAKRRGLTT
jgi:hypothetical protein